MRCGLVLALFEIGLALPVRFPALEEPLRRALFFLLPLGVYLLLGAAAGALAGWLSRRIPRFRSLLLLLPGIVAAGVMVLDVVRNLGPGGHLDRTALPAMAGGGLGVALAILAAPRRKGAAKAFRAAGGVVILLAAGGVSVWMGTERDPSLGVPASPTADPSRPSVVLLTWDTVRADVLPLYGGRGLEMPNLEKLAAQSVVFENMFAVAPITGPTHASLLSGVVPPSHGLRSNGTTGIDPSVPGIAQSFRDAGYDTAAFVSGYPVKGKFGFRRGFRIYDDRLYRDRLEGLAEMGPMEFTFLRVVALWFKQNATAAIPGSMVIPRVARYLEDARRPFFLWVHLFDAHGPHTPEEPFRSRCLELAKDAWPPPADPENCGRQMTLYRGELMELDSMLGDLLGMLEKQDPHLSRTAFYLTADHGHCFGEGGLINTHIPSLFDATQHIPAVLHLPGGKGAGKRVSAMVDQIDVAATLGDLAELPRLPGNQGQSLLPLALGKPPGPRAWYQDGFYMEAYQDRLHRKDHDDRKIGLRTPEWKFWKFVGSDEVKLFHVPEGEEKDYSGERPDLVARFEGILSRYEERMPRRIHRQELTPGDKDSLAQLGYIQGEEDDAAEKKP